MKNINISKLISVLRANYRRSRPPVAELIRSRGKASFKTLVTTILSSRTLDQTTSSASQKLFKIVQKPADFGRVSLHELENMIYPVGFYRVKARQLKKLPSVLEKEFKGRIPNTVEELMRLPGVGRKTANLVAAESFKRDEICVDVHVHRISNRLGLVKTRAPYETEQVLRRVIPRKYWRELNHLLVAFGQVICRPLHPKCLQCPLRKNCLYFRNPHCCFLEPLP